MSINVFIRAGDALHLVCASDGFAKIYTNDRTCSQRLDIATSPVSTALSWAAGVLGWCLTPLPTYPLVHFRTVVRTNEQMSSLRAYLEWHKPNVVIGVHLPELEGGLLRGTTNQRSSSGAATIFISDA
jgi:hypothetical protein